MTSPSPQILPETATRWPETLIHSVTQERRSRIRFPMDLAFSYRTLDRTGRRGAGRTLNISSTGILAAACCDRLTVGARVEITIEWPVRFDGHIPLQLVMIGSIVRCEPDRFAVAYSQLRLGPAEGPFTLDRDLAIVTTQGHLTGNGHAGVSVGERARPATASL